MGGGAIPGGRQRGRQPVTGLGGPSARLGAEVPGEQEVVKRAHFPAGGTCRFIGCTHGLCMKGSFGLDVPWRTHSRLQRASPGFWSHVFPSRSLWLCLRGQTGHVGTFCSVHPTFMGRVHVRWEGRGEGQSGTDCCEVRNESVVPLTQARETGEPSASVLGEQGRRGGLKERCTHPLQRALATQTQPTGALGKCG